MSDADGSDAPAFRIWPPVGVAVPWLIGWAVGAVLGITLGGAAWLTWLGWALVAAFVVWNGWCLLLFRRHTTGLLPGQRTNSLLMSGPYRLSRNPLYLGLLALYAGCALLADSLGALVLIPVAWAALQVGAILPEERYLTARLGAEYVDYRARVRRWW